LAKNLGEIAQIYAKPVKFVFWVGVQLCSPMEFALRLPRAAKHANKILTQAGLTPLEHTQCKHDKH
jgi:hypothetical protein